MGYFSNGTEGDMYTERYCDRCIHGQDIETGCPIFGLHVLYNSEQNRNASVAAMLDILIPYKDGHNQQCTMFTEMI